MEGYTEYFNKCGFSHYGYMKNFKFVDDQPAVIKCDAYEFSGVIKMDPLARKLTGLSKIKYKNGDIYEGETIDVMKNGFGLLQKKSNNEEQMKLFYGKFTNNKKDGLGISLKEDGTYTIGKFIDDEKEGGFLSCLKGQAKFDLYHSGFLSKTETEKEKNN